MNIRLHENATKTPRIRALIPAGDEPQTVLARYFEVTVQTLARWKHRDFALDRCLRRHGVGPLRAPRPASAKAAVTPFAKILTLSGIRTVPAWRVAYDGNGRAVQADFLFGR